MRMWPTRKCSSFADVEKFSDFRRSNGDFGPSNDEFGPSDLSKHSHFQHSNFRKHSNFQYQHRLALIQAHGDWLQQWLNEGWDGYLFTFMFNQLPGSRRAIVHQMHQQIERWYGRLATRTVRKPRSPVWAPLLPKGIFIPDLPVPKRLKQDQRRAAYAWNSSSEPLGANSRDVGCLFRGEPGYLSHQKATSHRCAADYS
jgi:hypothetical protein